MKKIIRFLVGIVVLLVLITYIPQFLHICTDCETFFIGAGYEQNILVDAVSDKKGILCKKCAEKHHALSVGLGKSLDYYKKPVELNPLTVIQQWID